MPPSPVVRPNLLHHQRHHFPFNCQVFREGESRMSLRSETEMLRPTLCKPSIQRHQKTPKDNAIALRCPRLMFHHPFPGTSHSKNLKLQGSGHTRGQRGACYTTSTTSPQEQPVSTLRGPPSQHFGEPSDPWSDSSCSSGRDAEGHLSTPGKRRDAKSCRFSETQKIVKKTYLYIYRYINIE